MSNEEARPPRATPTGTYVRPQEPSESNRIGSVVIPAHDEVDVIARTLRPIAPLASVGTLEVIVVCNGCTDDTARVARQFPGVTVLEIAQASKPAALNAGDAQASWWPRIYLDADIEVSPNGLLEVIAKLDEEDGLLAARPRAQYCSDGATWIVRCYFRARARIPKTETQLWGAGIYAVSASGKRRIGPFPDLTADDLWVDSHFTAREKIVIQTSQVLVRTPRNAQALLAVLCRTYHGNAQLARCDSGPGIGQSVTSLCRLLLSTRAPRDLVDTTVYIAYGLGARLATRIRRATEWERDATSRLTD